MKDINKDGVFISARRDASNPLEPSYTWRDQGYEVNDKYGEIGNRPKNLVHKNINKREDLNLGIYDIEGAKANSSNERRYFFSVTDVLFRTEGNIVISTALKIFRKAMLPV